MNELLKIPQRLDLPQKRKATEVLSDEDHAVETRPETDKQSTRRHHNTASGESDAGAEPTRDETATATATASAERGWQQKARSHGTEGDYDPVSTSSRLCLGPVSSPPLTPHPAGWQGRK